MRSTSGLPAPPRGGSSSAEHRTTRSRGAAPCTTCTPTGVRPRTAPRTRAAHGGRPGLARPAGQRRPAARTTTSLRHDPSPPDTPDPRDRPAGRDRRRRHRPRGDRRGAQGPRGGAPRSEDRADPLRPRSRALPRHRRGAARLRARRDPRPRRDPARRGRGQAGRPQAARRASSSAGCCCGCGSSSTTTSTCARRGSTPASRRRSPTPARSTSSSSARAPRVPTPATAARCAVGHAGRGRHRGQPQHGVRRGAGRPRRLRPRAAGGRAGKLTLVHKTNVLVHAGGALVADRRRGRRGVPRGRPSTTCTSTRPRSS